jgi:Zn-dependent oligopeptidase
MAQTPHRKTIVRVTAASFNASKEIQACRDTIRQLIAAIADVRSHRDVQSYESPEMQNAWDRLRVATMEAERALQKPVDKPRR